MAKNFRDLKIWQRSMDLAVRVYPVSKNFPKEEIYGLAAQLRRASVSVPSNIAEGHARQHDAEFRQFLHVALGSLAELETQLEIAERLGDVASSSVKPLLKEAAEIGRMINGLIVKMPKDL